MSHATRWIFNLGFALLVLQLSACALFEERNGPATYYGPRDQVYYATFEEVWRATNLVLQPYPLHVSNMDQGVLETDMIRGNKVWAPPYKPMAGNSGEAYHLSIHVIKGSLDNRPATRVTIVKDTEVQVDFFSDPKNIASTGLEEKSLLYRIGREILIERALAKIQKQKNQGTP